jgi:hypothetical protein
MPSRDVVKTLETPAALSSVNPAEVLIKEAHHCKGHRGAGLRPDEGPTSGRTPPTPRIGRSPRRVDTPCHLSQPPQTGQRQRSGTQGLLRPITPQLTSPLAVGDHASPSRADANAMHFPMRNQRCRSPSPGWPVLTHAPRRQNGQLMVSALSFADRGGDAIPIDGARPCPFYAPTFLVTPPNLTQSVKLAAGSSWGTQGFPGCGVLRFSPVVPGPAGRLT